MPTRQLPNLHDRDYIIPRSLTYVFSLKVEYCVDVPSALDGPALPREFPIPMQAKTLGPREWNTYHVLGDELVRTPLGHSLELPRARVSQGSSLLVVSRQDSVPFNGNLVLETDTDAILSLEHSGVLKLPGTTSSIEQVIHSRHPNLSGARAPIEGEVRASFRCTIDSPRFRWIALNQLVGVGKVLVTYDELLNFTADFDLYLGL